MRCSRCRVRSIRRLRCRTPDPATASTTLSNATNAKISVKQVAQGFNIDQETHLEATLQKLLEDPITNAEGLLRALGPAELNAKGKGLCAQFSAVTNNIRSILRLRPKRPSRK